MGKSLYLPELIDVARDLLQRAEANNKPILMPIDIVCGTSMDDESEAVVRSADAIEPDELLMDIGPETIKIFTEQLLAAGTIVWTGPLGVVELEKFQNGSHAIANCIASNGGYSVANGGDTLSLIESLNLQHSFSHLSTGGGSSLEFLQGKRLPAVTMMEESARVRYAVEREY